MASPEVYPDVLGSLPPFLAAASQPPDAQTVKERRKLVSMVKFGTTANRSGNATPAARVLQDLPEVAAIADRLKARLASLQFAHTRVAAVRRCRLTSA